MGNVWINPVGLNRGPFACLDPSPFVVWIFVERYVHKPQLFTRCKNARAHTVFVKKHQVSPDKVQSKHSRVETRIEFRIPLVWHMTLRYWVVAYISSRQRTTTALPTLEDEATVLSVNVLISLSHDWASYARGRNTQLHCCENPQTLNRKLDAFRLFVRRWVKWKP
jgi:hypothetical protein